MKTTSMPSRVLAMLAGAVFLSGTVAIMFEDVILRAAPLALKHWVALTLLAGTIFAGHLADVARQSRQWLTATAFVVVFLSGSALIVYLSAGRQADATIQTTAQINDDAERRIEITAARSRAQKMLERAQGELASECKTGRGTRCDGIRTTIAVYEAALGGHDAALRHGGLRRVDGEVDGADALERSAERAERRALRGHDPDLFAELLHAVPLVSPRADGYPTARRDASPPRAREFRPAVRPPRGRGRVPRTHRAKCAPASAQGARSRVLPSAVALPPGAERVGPTSARARPRRRDHEGRVLLGRRTTSPARAREVTNRGRCSS